MTGQVDLDVELGGILGGPGEWSFDEVREQLAARDDAAWSTIETTFGQAGWYGGGIDPYPPPPVPFNAPRPAKPKVVTIERRLWLTRYNPASPDFDEPDIADDTKFPWTHPEAAPRDGWWLSSRNRPKNRLAIAEIVTGDLVICQRTHPTRRGDGDLVGICTIGMTDAWDDVDTGQREYAACLVPLAKFTHPVPRRTAHRHGRLRVDSLSKGQQLPGRQGPIGFGLSYVEEADTIELLSVCGISPEALAEPDNARLATRLRATDTGNPLFHKLRYDAVLRHQVRRAHELEAERRAEKWAADHGYLKHDGYDHVPLSGFDLLFVDGAGVELQVEVKGYLARTLATVHLQPSQAKRATEAAAGTPPDWRLFALLGAGTKNSHEHVRTPQQVVELLANGGIQVKGGRPGG